MKLTKRIAALGLAIMLCLGLTLPASAASAEDAIIDMDAKASLTIYNYDLTDSQIDGAWDSSYESTGVADQNVTGTLADYAIEGTVFSYLKVADVVQHTDGNKVVVLYAIDKTQGASFLAALGLSNGANRYQNADALDSTKYYYQSDVLIDALADALEANATNVKNALEPYAKENGTAMAATDATGKTEAKELPLGLYLICTTAVEESTVVTSDPWLVSLPMTAVNGTNATDGGTRWIYDVTVYPKNLTGIPSLEKTLKNADSATAAYVHTATASSGDQIDFKIVSTLPSITSAATYLSEYTLVDTLAAGLSYKKGDVKVTFYTDKACTDEIATWTEADGKFTVTYTENGMTVSVATAGLTEINTAETVYIEDDMVNAGYSDCTMVITYSAAVDSDSSVVCGDNGNGSKTVLTWKRTNNAFYDTLVDDAHVFTYAIDLTKVFSDNNGDCSKVKFVVRNSTDGYYVKAELNEEEGVYYVTGAAADEAAATQFVPTSDGSVVIKGLEDDSYTITETQTDNGYILLKKDINVVITTTATTTVCDIYTTDVVGLLQNDPRYTEELIQEAVTNGYITEDGGLANILNNLAQTKMEHTLLTAAATVDGDAVTMLADAGSANAVAPLTVVNDRGFNAPDTGDFGSFLISGIGAFSAVGLVAVIALGKKKQDA